MKQLIQLILLVAFGTLQAQNDTVTFKVDMNDYNGSSYTTVNVNGTFNGWCGGCNPMTDANSDGVWEVSLPLTAGTIEYKFTLDGWTGQENFSPGGSCTVTAGGFTNRELTFSGNHTILPVVCYNSCSACTGVVLSVADFPITWDDATVNYSTVSFGGNIDSIKPDPTDATNTVLKLDKGLGTQTWAGTTISNGGLANPIPFTIPGANTISVRFWSPDAGAAVLCKVEDKTNPGIFVEAIDTTTVAGGWQILTFDYNNPAPNALGINTANTYDLVSIFPNFGVDGNTAGAKSYYVDDVVYGTITTGMAGVYTIDPAGSGSMNYTSFSAAAADLVSLGVVGACTFNVAPGIYTDTVYLPAIAGTSSTNTITFNGGDSATTTLAYNTAAANQNAVILMDGADYVSFENLTITHPGTTDSWGIRMQNDNDNLTVDACRFEMAVTTSTSSDIAAIASTGSATSSFTETEGGDNTTIINSAFINGQYGVHFEALAAFSDSNFVINDNTFEGNYYRHFMSDNTYNMTLNGNTMSGMAYGFGYAMALYDVIGFEINGNTITCPDWGIYISDGNFDGTPPATSNVTNNMVTSSGDEAFYADDFEMANVYYNTFATTSTSTSAYGAYFNDFVTVDVRNNVFYGNATYAVYFSDNTTLTSTTAGPLTLDYNIYHSVSGSNLAYDAGAQADLAAWQTARTGNNTNSLSGDPIFLDPTSDLHMAGGLANNAATPIASVTVDIDGDMRSASTPDMGADEYMPASCLPVSGVTTLMAYADSVDLAWIGNNGASATFNIEYGALGFSPGTGTTITAHPDSTITITGLMANSDYEVYITANCGSGGLASVVGPTAFRTALAGPRAITCATGTLGSLLTEEFDNSTTFTGDIAAGNGTWLYDNNTTGSSNTGPSGPQSGSHYTFVETSTGGPDSASMVSPAIDLAAASQNVELSFWLHAYGANIGTLKVGVSTSATGPFTTEFSYGPGQLQTDELDPWQNVGVNLDAYLGQTIYVEFRYIRGSSFEGDLAIDLVEVKSCLSCLTPSSLASSNITATSADITWISGASNLGSTVEYGPAGFTPGTGTILSTTAGTVSLTGLSQNTSYEVYVTDSCGTGDISSSAGPLSFTTACGVIIPPSIEDFATGWTPNPCWEEGDGGTPATGPSALGLGGWSTDGFANNGTTGAVKINLYNVGDEDWILSPQYDLGTAGNMQVEFDFGVFAWNSSNPANLGSDDQVQLLISTDNGLSWTNLATYDNTYTTSVSGNHEIASLSSYSGVAQFAIWATEGSTDDPEDNDIFVDNFEVKVAPSCFSSSALTVISTTNNSAELTWTAGTGTSWDVEYGPIGFTPGSGTLVNSTNDTLTITGLSSATGYEFYVTDSCGAAGLSSMVGPESFFTKACAASASCVYTLNLYDAYGDGWNGGEITVWQSGVPVGIYGTNFTSGDTLAGINLSLCDGIPAYVTLSNPGAWSSEMSFDLSNPLGLVQGMHAAAGGLSQGDTLVVFTTDCSACPALMAPYEENFDLSSTPNCWSQEANSGGPWVFSTSGLNTACGGLGDNTGNGGNYAWMDQSATDDSVSLIMPVIDISGLTTPFYEFYYSMCGSGYTPFNLTIIEYWDGAAWMAGDTLDFATNGWQLISDTIPSAWTFNSGTNVQLRFRAESGGASLDFNGDNAIDDVRIYEAPSCFFPSNAAISNVTSTSFDVTWTSNASASYGVIYGPLGFDPATTGSLITTTGDSVNISGLSPTTFYSVYIYSDCGMGDLSDTLGPLTINTLCPASFTAPYTTDFENITLGYQASYENCWTIPSTATPRWEAEDASGANENSTGTGPFYDNGSFGLAGGTYMYLETSSGTTGATGSLSSPLIDFSSLTSPELSFYYHMYGATMGTLRVYAEDAAGTLTVLDSIVGQQQTAGSDAWLKMSIDLSSLSGTSYNFVFEGERGSSFTGDISIDDFSIAEAPNCSASSQLSLITAGNTSAEVTWTAGSGTSWDIEYGPAGFSPGTGTTFNATNDTVTISGLMASTSYDFYVTDSCGSANGVATTAGPGTFSTAACALTNQCAYTVDLYDTFGDGWNGGEITVLQNGVAVASFGSSFSTGASSLGNIVNLCDNVPTTITLSTAGAWPSEIGVVITNPNGDTAGVHIASGTVGTGDTLISFTSDCSSCPAVAAPYFESFEANSPTVGCWTNVFVEDSLTWTIGSGSSGGLITTAYAGTQNAVFESASGGPDTTLFVSPIIDMSALVSPQLSFWYAQEEWFGDQNVTNVYYRASATDPWTFLFGDNTNKNTWTQALVSLPNASSTYQIAIEGINNWGHANVIDSLSITDAALVCTAPDSVAAANVTTTNADITWASGSNQSSSWIEYGLLGFTPGTGTIINPATNPTTLSGLMPGTIYEACVYDICSALGDTSSAGCVTFTTLCAPVDVYPYTENFDLGLIPACYTSVGTTTGPFLWAPNSGGTTSSSTGPAGDNTSGTGFYLYTEASSPAAAGDSAILTLPEFDLTPLTVPEISYFYHMYGADIQRLDLQVYDATSMTWTTIDSILGQQQSGSADAWLEARVDLSAYNTNTNLQLRFITVRGASFNGDVALDDITVRETPACVDPTNLMVTNATGNSVSLSWNSDTNIVASTIEYGPVGFALGTGTQVIGTPNAYTLAGLANAACFDFYVRDSCSSATAWIGPVTACTIANCSVSSVPVSASSDTTDCDGGSVSLSAVSSSSNDLVWLNNGQAVGTGASYVSDSISFTTAFDVAEFVTTTPVLHIGPLTNIATAGYGNFSNGQWITVNDTVHIDSMVVNHDNDVTAQLVLWTDDTFTNLISLSDTFTTPAGVTGDLQVPVNMVVTPGVYFMNVNFISGAGALFRATGGANYPYNLAGLMSIDSTNFADQSRIYYTFDMTVSKACIGTSIQGFGVVPGANAGTSDSVSVCSTESMVDLTSFLGVYDLGGTWSDLSSTGALTDSLFDATSVASGASYDFSYVLAGVNGCAGDTAFLIVTVEEAPDAGTDSSFAVCIGSGNLILRPFITGNPFGGTWVDLDNSGALNSTGVWRANVATVGTFRIAYILSGVVCDPDTAILTIMSDSAVSAGMAVSDTVCDDEAMVDLSTFLDASASAGGTWTELTSTGALTANIFDATSVTTNSSYDFQYKVMSACGDDSIVVSLYVNDCDVSVRELNTGFIKIYPNPTSGLIKIEDKSVKGQVQVELYSANGQLMMSKNFGENEDMSLDISDYATGIYTVKVNSEKGLDVKRIMKQ